MAARRVDQRAIRAGVDADDFSYRPLPRILVGPFGESDAEAVAEVVL